MSMLKLLASNNFITYSKVVAKKLGINEAILLGELCSISCMYENEFDEFYFTQEKIENDTALSKYQISEAMKVLEANSIVSVNKKGIPCRNFYKLNPDGLDKILTSSSQETEPLEVKKLNRQKSKNLTTSSQKTEPHLNNNTNKNLFKNTNNNTIDFDFVFSTEYQKQIYEKWTEYNLFAPKNYLSFLQYEYKNATPYLKGIHSDQVFKAIDNYASVKRLGDDTWFNADFRFDSFAKKIQDFLPDRFDINHYLTKEAKAKQTTTISNIKIYEFCPKCNAKFLEWKNDLQKYECDNCKSILGYEKVHP